MRATQASQSRPLPRRRAIVAVAVAAVTIDTALLGLIAPLLPEIERRTGASEWALGASIAAYRSCCSRSRWGGSPTRWDGGFW